MDPDQTAPIGTVCSGSTLFASILNSSVILGNYLQQTTSADDIFRCIFLAALRVNPVAEGKFCYSFLNFLRKQCLIFHVNHLLAADDSHEMSSLVWFLKHKIWKCLLLQTLGGALIIKFTIIHIWWTKGVKKVRSALRHRISNHLKRKLCWKIAFSMGLLFVLNLDCVWHRVWHLIISHHYI